MGFLLAAFGFVGLFLVGWFVAAGSCAVRSRPIGPGDEAAAAELLRHVDGDGEFDQGSPDDEGVADAAAASHVTGRGPRNRYIGIIVRLAKSEFGPMEDSHANHLVVRKWMRDRMREHNVRNTHIGDLLPIAEVMFFVPTRAEVAAKRIRSTACIAQRRLDSDVRWYHLNFWLPQWSGNRGF